MVVFAALGGIGAALIDLTPLDEKEKRAAKAAVWASMAAAGAASGIDGASAAVGAVMAAKEIAGIVVEDAKVMQVVDAGAAVATAAVSGNYVEAGKVVGGAAVGAAVGGATGGTEGMANGMQLGTTLAGGDLSQMGGKAIGAAAGAGVAAATSEGDGKALLAGAQLGASVGGTATDIAGSRFDAGQPELSREALGQSSLGTAIEGSTPTAAKPMAASDLRLQGAIQGTGQAAGMAVAGVMHEERDEDRSWAESLQVGAAAGGAVGGAVNGIKDTKFEDPEAPATASESGKAAVTADAAQTHETAEARPNGVAEEAGKLPESTEPNGIGVRESARRMAEQTPHGLKVATKLVGLAAQAGGVADLVIDQTVRVDQEEASEYAERFPNKRRPRREAEEAQAALEETRKQAALIREGQRFAQLRV